MKKLVLATLLATSSLVASAQVAMSGKVSMWVDNNKVGAASATNLVTEPTSNIAVSAKEDLGGGLAARAVVETSLQGNTVSGADTRLGDRQTTIGVATKFGSVDFGRNVHSHFLAITDNDVFGTLYGSVAGDVHNLRGLRLGNAGFASLSPMKNVHLSVEREFNGVGTNAQVVALGGKFKGVDGVYARYENGKETSTVLGLSTKMAGATFAYTHSDNAGVAKSKGDLFGVSKGFGAVTAKASYGKTNTNVKAYALGADYAFSKRTEVGVAYRNVDKVATANDVKELGVGLTHRF